ncbi:MAG: site-specific integrase [Tannerellaceae bacterium]|jgi:integrase|nr:site-specific integrase [Tannerellaceae bacterium]
MKELKRQKGESKKFVDFMKEEMERSCLSASTKKSHLSTIRLINLFKSEIEIKDINYEFLSGFGHFLSSQKYGDNTISKHMKHIKRYINIAINLELYSLEKYPFRRYKIANKVTSRSFMTPEELERFEKLEITKNGSLQRSLDVFLFCCYTGMRFSDVIRLKNDNFTIIEGMPWLSYTTVKTKTEIRIPLYLVFESKALILYNKYMGKYENFFNISNQSNSNINKQLLYLAKKANINKRISFHSSRHTNATLLLYYGANITTVQKLLGHQSVQTTEIYSKVLDMTIIRDLEDVIERKKKRNLRDMKSKKEREIYELAALALQPNFSLKVL